MSFLLGLGSGVVLTMAAGFAYVWLCVLKAPPWKM